jgi:hypothetical protein
MNKDKKDTVLSYEEVPLDSSYRPKPSGEEIQMPRLGGYCTSDTMPWGASKPHQSPPIMPPVTRTLVPSSTRTDIPICPIEEAEARENARLLSERISSVPKYVLPDLKKLLGTVTDTETFVEESKVFETIMSTQETLLQEAPQSTFAETEAVTNNTGTVQSVRPAEDNEIRVLKEEIIPPAMPAETASKETERPSELEQSVPPLVSPSTIPPVSPANDAIKQIAKAPLPVEEIPVRKVSLWESMRSSAKSVTGLIKRHSRAAAVAAGVAVTALTGGLIKHTANQSQVDNQPQTSYQTPDASMSVHSKENLAKKEQAETVKAARDEKKTETVTAVKNSRKVAEVLTSSKSPIVQDILTRGETRLTGNTITDTMIVSFRGLATNEQILQLNELQNSVNLGISVYLNEHFGTAAKTAESLKDPKLRNLYRTAQAEQKSGRLLPYLTKEKFPQQYKLAERIFADSAELGLDQSSSNNPAIQDRVSGNMFQAKVPGDSIKLRKADGSYHVILETVLDVFEGKNTRQALKEKLSGPLSEKPETGIHNAPDQTQRIYNNINQVNSSTVESEGSHQDATEKGRGETGNNDTLNNLRTAPELEEDFDAAWEKIAAGHDRLAAERDVLKKDRLVNLTLEAGLTTKQEKAAIIPMLAEKLAAMHPHADADRIKGLVRRYGYIGLASVKTEKREVAVTLNKNFQKILEEAVKA